MMIFNLHQLLLAVKPLTFGVEVKNVSENVSLQLDEPEAFAFPSD